MSKNPAVTIYDVAGAARVSMATVSRVLNNPDKVNSTTREIVLRIIDELGYIPNPTARELATKKFKPTLCIIVSDLTHAFVSSVINGILNKADELNFSMKISVVSKKKNLKEFLEYLIGEKNNGFILIDDKTESIKYNETPIST